MWMNEIHIYVSRHVSCWAFVTGPYKLSLIVRYSVEVFVRACILWHINRSWNPDFICSSWHAHAHTCTHTRARAHTHTHAHTTTTNAGRESTCQVLYTLQSHSFDIFLTVPLRIILAVDQRNAQILVLQYVYYIPLHVSSTVVLIIRRSNCIIQYLVSSHTVDGRPVSHVQIVTIPVAV